MAPAVPHFLDKTFVAPAVPHFLDKTFVAPGATFFFDLKSGATNVAQLCHKINTGVFCDKYSWF